MRATLAYFEAKEVEILRMTEKAITDKWREFLKDTDCGKQTNNDIKDSL